MQPTPYVPSADYSADVSPGDLGNALDADHDALKLTTDEIRANIALLQRDDTKLANGIVHPDSLSLSTVAMMGSWTPRGAWLTATAYEALDFVVESDATYVCMSEHVSGIFATDLAAGRWTALSKVDGFATAFSLTLLDDTTAAAWLTTLGISAFAQTILDDAAATNVLTTLGVSAFAKTILDDVAAANVLTTLGITAFAQSILDDANAAAARTTLDVPGNSEAILKTIFGAKGDLIAASADDTPSILTVGADGSPLLADSTQTAGFVYGRDILNGLINGLTIRNNVVDPTNDIDILTGACMDQNGFQWMRLGGVISKRLDANWVVGSGQGGLDTGAIANADYYVWLIKRHDTGVVDALFSQSATSPTLPANYISSRRIGWFKRVAGAIVGFKAYETQGGGLEVLWDSPTLDIDLTNTLTTTRRVDAVKVPLDFATTAHLNAVINDASPGAMAWIYCPDQTDLAPSNSAAPLNNAGMTSTITARQLFVRTNGAGQIAARSDTATIDTYRVVTIGFTWSRR